jgi:hypothetical protein
MRLGAVLEQFVLTRPRGQFSAELGMTVEARASWGAPFEAQGKAMLRPYKETSYGT